MAYWFVLCDLSSIDMKFCFSKQYRYVTDHFLVYLTNYYIFAQLPSYFLLCAVLLSMPVSPQT